VYAMLTCTHFRCPATAACAALDLKLDARARFARAVELSCAGLVTGCVGVELMLS
jgi:hypothetical protein